MDGPRRLVDWPWVTVEVECSLCRRRGRYRAARLAERFGAAMELTALLRNLAARCGLNKPEVKPRQYEARCGARFLVPTGGPLPAEAPGRAKPEGAVAPRRRRLGPEGPLPTVGDTRRQGITMVRICCEGLRCGAPCQRTGEVALEALGVPDDAAFVHIPRLRRFRCRNCGSDKVRVLPCWPDPRMQHAARMGAQPRTMIPGTMREYRTPGLDDPPPP